MLELKLLKSPWPPLSCKSDTYLLFMYQLSVKKPPNTGKGPQLFASGEGDGWGAGTQFW